MHSVETQRGTNTAAQVVMGANIVGVGRGLEVGTQLEVLKIRQAEALAEEARRLGTHSTNSPRVRPCMSSCCFHLLPHKSVVHRFFVALQCSSRITRTPSKFRQGCKLELPWITLLHACTQRVRRGGMSLLVRHCRLHLYTNM